MAFVVIEGCVCTLFFDYDYRAGIFGKLTEDGRIEWMERRFHMIFLDPLREIISPDTVVYHALEHPVDKPPLTAHLMAVAWLLNGIQVLGGFCTESDDEQTQFHAFMRYLPNDWGVMARIPYPSVRLSEILWTVYRCGLSRNMALLGVGIEHDARGRTHQYIDGVLQVNPSRLLADVIDGFHRMFGGIRRSRSLERDYFIRRFDALMEVLG
jgi:hypothetical protein